MGRLIKLIALTLFTIGLMPLAQAQVNIDGLVVQGYMKKANGQPVTDSTGPGYTIAVGVLQGGVYVWGRSYTVPVTNGLFSITLGGIGTDLSSGATNCTTSGADMKLNFSAGGLNRTLNPALLIAQGATDLTVHVCAVSTIDSSNPEFNIPLKSVATAYVAGIAKAVVDSSITLASINASATIGTGGNVGDAGKLVILGTGGLLDVSLIPDLPSSIITTGQVGVGNGGTGSNDGSITGTGNITYMSAAGSTTNIGNNTAASILALRSGTGGITATVTGTTGDVAFSAGTTSGNVDLTSGSAGKVRVTNGTGLELVHGSGSVTVNAPLNPTSYTLNLPGNGGTANYFLQNTDGAGTTTWAQAALPGANTDIVSLNPTGALTLGNAATTGVSVLPNGGVTMNPAGVIAVGGAASTGVSINPAGAVAISPTSGGVTFNPTGTIAIGGAATTAISVSPTAPVTFAGTGAVSLIPTGNLTLAPTGSVALAPSAGVTVGGTGAVVINPTGDITLNPTGNIDVGGAATQTLTLDTVGTGSLVLGSTSNTVSLGGTGATIMNVGTSSTGNLTITVGSTATTGSKTILQSGTVGKIQIGASGTAFTRMGVCTTAAYAPTNNITTSSACAGMPTQATPAAVSCSGNNNPSVAASITCRQNIQTAGFVRCTTGATAQTQMMTFACSWILP